MSVADLVVGAPFPLYGLDQSFRGVRWLNSWERSREPDKAANMLSLAHGDSDDAMVEVAVRRRDPLIDILDTLDGTIALGLYPAASDLNFDGWFKLQEDNGLREVRWTTIELAVDGRGDTFAFRQVEDHWVGLLSFPDIWLYIHSRGIPLTDVALATVTDRQIYLDGLVRLGHHDPYSS
jgi:hypothetical protein